MLAYSYLKVISNWLPAIGPKDVIGDLLQLLPGQWIIQEIRHPKLL